MYAAFILVRRTYMTKCCCTSGIWSWGLNYWGLNTCKTFNLLCAVISRHNDKP